MDGIINNLAPLPQLNNVYLATESTPDCYEPNSKYLTDHPPFWCIQVLPAYMVEYHDNEKYIGYSLEDMEME
jgi:hypothetical protein